MRRVRAFIPGKRRRRPGCLHHGECRPHLAAGIGLPQLARALGPPRSPAPRCWHRSKLVEAPLHQLPTSIPAADVGTAAKHPHRGRLSWTSRPQDSSNSPPGWPRSSCSQGSPSGDDSSRKGHFGPQACIAPFGVRCTQMQGPRFTGPQRPQASRRQEGHRPDPAPLQRPVSNAARQNPYDAAGSRST